MSISFKVFDYQTDETHRKIWNQIREEIFIVEQECPVEIEYDGLDTPEFSTHVIMFLDQTAMGIARILRNTKNYKNKFAAKYGRVAILKNYRRQGYAGKLVTFCDKFCLENPDFFDQIPQLILLHVQNYTRSLYEKLGYVCEGELFMEDFIEHVKAVKYFTKA